MASNRAVASSAYVAANLLYASLIYIVHSDGGSWLYCVLWSGHEWFPGVTIATWLAYGTVCCTDTSYTVPHGAELIPRSRYCGRCQKTVCRYDHHCPFVGCCVGEKNALPFVALCILQCWSAAMYLVHMIFPSVGFISTHDTLTWAPFNLVLIVALLFLLICTGGGFFFALAHIGLIVKNVTTREFFQGYWIGAWDEGVLKNIAMALQFYHPLSRNPVLWRDPLKREV